MASHALIDATARFFGGELSSIFKGITLASALPVIFIVIITVVITSLLASLLADSPGPYSPFGKRVAVAASDFWTNRHQYGLSGRTFEGLGPLEDVLDALAQSVRKYETNEPAPNQYAEDRNTNYHGAPQFISQHQPLHASGSQYSHSQVRFQ